MQVNPYLSFDGQCEEAFKLYEKCFDGKMLFSMTYGEAPGFEKTPEWDKKIMHATLSVGDRVIQGADAPPGGYQKPQGMTLSINLSDQEQAERIFATLANGGSVQMPLAETFWALRFGMVVDRFGTPWLINCEKPAQ